MLKGEKSKRGGIEDLLCPFTDMYITQGSNEGTTHKGTKSMDVRGAQIGVRYPYYAPCRVRCIKVYPSNGQVMWQSTDKVRFADGTIDFITFMTAHDNSLDSYPGQIVEQGSQLGNMGNKGNASGVHCHIEVTRGADTTWIMNKYGNYAFPNEIEFEDAFFMNNTNIISGKGVWKYTDSIIVVEGEESKNYANLSPNISSWRVYDLHVKPIARNAKGKLNPKKFGGLTYYIYSYMDEGTTAEIETGNFGRVKIYIVNENCKITINNPLYQYGEY